MSADDRKPEPTQRTEKGLEIPVPTRKAWDETLSKIVKPVNDDEAELPADDTDED
jgi:hypothetical protein